VREESVCFFSQIFSSYDMPLAVLCNKKETPRLVKKLHVSYLVYPCIPPPKRRAPRRSSPFALLAQTLGRQMLLTSLRCLPHTQPTNLSAVSLFLHFPPSCLLVPGPLTTRTLPTFSILQPSWKSIPKCDVGRNDEK
jgi:hypothetical protein